MDVDKFLKLVERLTGTPVQPLGDIEQHFLARVLRDDGKKLDCTQMNELLLLVNKDRVEPPFFEAFFTKQQLYAPTPSIRGCSVAEIEAGVERFQKVAMLAYGNFIFAYRKLARIRTTDELQEELADQYRAPEGILKELKGRSPVILEIEPISRDHTYLVGYLSARQISDDKTYAELLSAAARQVTIRLENHLGSDTGRADY